MSGLTCVRILGPSLTKPLTPASQVPELVPPSVHSGSLYMHFSPKDFWSLVLQKALAVSATLERPHPLCRVVTARLPLFLSSATHVTRTPTPRKPAAVWSAEMLEGTVLLAVLEHSASWYASQRRHNSALCAAKDRAPVSSALLKGELHGLRVDLMGTGRAICKPVLELISQHLPSSWTSSRHCLRRE